MRALLLYFITDIFNKCMASKETAKTTQIDRTKYFRACVYTMAEVDECGTWGQGCAPTLNMLRKSEVPMSEIGTKRFGEAYPPTGHPTPATSACTAYKIWS